LGASDSATQIKAQVKAVAAFKRPDTPAAWDACSSPLFAK